ncbi:MAG: protein kinase [Planctomycetaceae bacterium]|nr:protein kinase [Planctomycetaceae bacterium]
MAAPDTADSDDALDDYASVDVLASDFIERFRCGDQPTVEEYAQRHPQLSDSIRRVFPLALSVERVKIDQQTDGHGQATLAGKVIERLGDFQLVREIGRGGMGIVFEARQESLARTVAIKVLPRQSLLDAAALERFQREARTAAAMHHSHIVPIFGTGSADGAHYLVMQLVDGESLDRLIARHGAMDAHTTAVIGRQVADALAYSHASGVLHRDIKPANILIDDDGSAQVTDFGLARNTGDDPTMTQALCGSPRYMAPERFRGVSDARSDVYGLGVTLYELLAGTPAFDQSDPHQLMDAVRTAKTGPLSQQQAQVPGDLATIVEKAMSADPADRYPTADALRDDLDRFLADEAILARPATAWQKLVRWCRRNPRIATAVSVAAGSLVLATVASTLGWLATASANRRAQAALQQSEQTMDLALSSLDSVVDLVSIPATAGDTGIQSADDPGWNVKPSPSSVKVLQQLQPLYERLAHQSPTRADIVGQMIQGTIQLARIERQLGQTDAAIASLQHGAQVLRERSHRAGVSSDDQQLWLARLRNELADACEMQLQFSEADAARAQAIELTQDREDAAARFQLARAHLALGDPPPPRRRGATHQMSESKRLQHLQIASDLLEGLHESTPGVSETAVLRAQVSLAESRLQTDAAARQQRWERAIRILHEQRDRTPGDLSVQFALVQSLAALNVRRDVNTDAERSQAAARLEEALTELRRIRSEYPDAPVFTAFEVHVRHKLSVLARGREDLASAVQQLQQAIGLQGRLIETSPDNFVHRCWRALLFRSLSEVYRTLGEEDARQAAITAARADLADIAEVSRRHPFVLETGRLLDAL